MMDANRKIKDCSMTDAAVAIAAMLTKSYMKLGYSFNDSYPLDAMSVDVLEMLRERHPNVTIGQIQQAINNGINGDYGEVRGLAPVDIVRFVKEYTIPTNVVNYQAPEEKQPLLLNRDVNADRINFLCEIYRQYYHGTDIVLCVPCGVYITLLWNYNMLLNIKDVTVQKRYMELAKETLRREKLAMIGGNPRIADIIKKDLQDMSEKEIKEKSYKLIILDFFKDCKEMDIKDLKELFKN